MKCVDDDAAKCAECSSGYRVVNGGCVAETIDNCEVNNCVKCVDDDAVICGTCESGYKKAADGKCVAQTTDKKCGQGQYLSSSDLCLPCPSSCSSCLSATYCTGCSNSLNLNNGKCEECFEKFEGCEECENSRCTKCLRSFQLENDGQCATRTSLPTLQFEFRGYGEFELQKGKKKISFKMYFKLNSGMMYGCKIKFSFYIGPRRRILGKRKLEEEGECDQIGIAQGSQASNPTAIDKLAVMNCSGEVSKAIEDGDMVSVSEAEFTIVNGKTNPEPILKEEEKNKVISNLTTSEIYDNFVKRVGPWYDFNQAGKCKCSYRNNITNFLLKGSVENGDKIDETNYIIQTSGNNATCSLNKPDENSESSTLNCTVDNNRNGFTIVDKQDPYNSNATLNLLMGNSNKQLCSVEGDSKPSSSGLSGGAIAGTIVACVVGVAVIGAIIFVVSKGMIAKGALAGASYTSTPQLTNVSKGNLTADKLGEYSV